MWKPFISDLEGHLIVGKQIYLKDSVFGISWKDLIFCPSVKELEPVCVCMSVCLSMCGEEYGEKFQ